MLILRKSRPLISALFLVTQITSRRLMQIIKTPDFQEQLETLPKHFQRFFSRQEKIFLENTRDPRLHLKKLNVADSIFSFRVTRSYRCLFYFHKPEIVIFFTIDHRKDVYRQL